MQGGGQDQGSSTQSKGRNTDASGWWPEGERAVQGLHGEYSIIPEEGRHQDPMAKGEEEERMGENQPPLLMQCEEVGE